MGLKNFEEGLVVDGPLYATIARHWAEVESSSWFRLDSGLPDFNPFVEHPPLGIWLSGMVFKLLPAHDWSARIPGHLYYVAFLVLFFTALFKRESLKCSVFAVLLIVATWRFSSYFNNAYLDPGLIFWGYLALFSWQEAFSEKRSLRAAFVAGASLVLAFLSKGMAVVGFIPVIVLWAAYWQIKDKNIPWFRTLFFVTGIMTIALPFYIALKNSDLPNYFSLYWERQYTGRFAQAWNLNNLFSWSYWETLFRHTQGLILIACPALYFSWKQPQRFLIPTILVWTHIVLFAATARLGDQYILPLQPCLAWITALLVSKWIPVSGDSLMLWSWRLALMAIVVVQYTPIPVRKSQRPDGIHRLETILERDPRPHHIISWSDHTKLNFPYHAGYVWTLHKPVSEYIPNNANPPQATQGYVLLALSPLSENDHLARSAGWCRVDESPTQSIWLPQENSLLCR